MSKRYVQYGCGLSCPEGWINYDSSPTLIAERLPVIGSLMRRFTKTTFPIGVKYGDIVVGLPEKERCATGVYASHILEHLDRESVTSALKNTFKILAPGGIFRLIVPCIEWRARQMISEIDLGDPFAVDKFMRAAHLGSYSRNRDLSQRFRRVFGNSHHLWMYDYRLMERLLQEAGFVGVRRCEKGDSGDPMFDRVEDIGRFIDHGNVELAIEARRPLQQAQALL